MNQALVYDEYTVAAMRARSSSGINEILELVDNPRTSVARLASVISKDASLTKRLLRQANSPLYGFQRRVSDPNFAVVLLGFDALKEMVVRSVVSGAFRRMVDTMMRFESFWTHSIGCALGSRLIALKTGACDANDAFVAGLLHDVGYVIINQTIMDRFYGKQEIQAKEKNAECSQPLPKTGHPEIGAALVERWHLSQDIVEAIRFHHCPEAATVNPSLVSTVHIAEALCHKLCIGLTDYETVAEVEPAAKRILGLDQSLFELDTDSGYVNLFREELSRAPKFATLIQELRTNLVEAMGELEEKQRLVVALLYYEGLSVEEAARLLGISVQAVEQLQNAAFARLRAAITCIAQ
jgi:RNA polymerase sigma factor (sigma-70 family)